MRLPDRPPLAPPSLTCSPRRRPLSPPALRSYGPLNILCYNVGLHQEHHDFPAIPWTRLWKLKALAPEFYDVLPSHSSWPGVTWRFITGACLLPPPFPFPSPFSALASSAGVLT